jgi:hypothetical protein
MRRWGDGGTIGGTTPGEGRERLDASGDKAGTLGEMEGAGGEDGGGI